MTGELPGPAAQVQHPPPVYVGQKRQEIGMLRGSLPPGAESLEGRVAGEEGRVIVDVLRLRRGHEVSIAMHFRSFAARCAVMSAAEASRTASGCPAPREPGR